MTGSQKYQLALFYMLAYADRRCIDDKLALIKELTKDYTGITEGDRRKFIEFAKKYVSTQEYPENAVISVLGNMKPNLSKLIKGVAIRLGKQVTYDNPTEADFRELVGYSAWFTKEEKYFTVTYLNLLGYIGEKYSLSEEKIVSHITKSWNIPNTNSLILKDCGETVWALFKKQATLNNYYSSKKYSTYNEELAAKEKIKKLEESTRNAITRISDSIIQLAKDSNEIF